MSNKKLLISFFPNMKRIGANKIATNDSLYLNFSFQRAQLGITLIEILVIISIIGIFASIAVPSMVDGIQSSEIKSLSSRFKVATHLAKSEAVKRGVQVSIKPLETTGNSWLKGWNVFIDPNSNGLQDTGEELIQTFNIAENGLTLTSIDNVFGRWIGFLPSGAVKGTGGISGGFQIIRPGADISKSRCIIIQGSGNIIVEEGTSPCV